MTACRLNPALDHDNDADLIDEGKTLEDAEGYPPYRLLRCPGCDTDVARASDGRCDACNEASHEGPCRPMALMWMHAEPARATS